MRTNIPDGVPRMFFLCHHMTTSRAPFIVGASQENWVGIESIKDIRRSDRDHRVARYATLAEESYTALRKAEETVELPDEFQDKPSEVRLCEARKLAIAKMRTNPVFLGRTLEAGQAFDSKLRAKKCCYVCQGMMGYKVPMIFAKQDVDTYLCHFNWTKRGGYAVSCAEIVASAQCSQQWQIYHQNANT